jgi:hypothetical protein
MAAVQLNTATTKSNFANLGQVSEAVISGNKALVQNNGANVIGEWANGDGKNVAQISNKVGDIAQINKGAVNDNYAVKNQLNACTISSSAGSDQTNDCGIINNDPTTQINAALITGNAANRQTSNIAVNGNWNSEFQQNSAFITNNVATNTATNTGIEMLGNYGGKQENAAGIIGNKSG